MQVRWTVPWLWLVVGFFVVAGCVDGASGVGSACVQDDDCPTGTCYIGPGGGYCTVPCEDEGATTQCPVDTVCKPIQGGARRCLLVCGSERHCPEEGGCDAAFCPEGSTCVDVSNSSLKACEPKP